MLFDRAALRPLAIAGVAAGHWLLAAMPADAATCEQAVAEFAESLGLAAAPPAPLPQDGGTGGSVAPDALAESGGVIAPPATGDPAVIEPPKAAGPMPTAPEIEPEPDDDTAAVDEAARQAQVDSLLAAARAAAAQGDEAECLARLDEARALAENGG